MSKPLTPAAQAVLDAVHGIMPYTSIAEVLAIAAALRTAVDQVVPDDPCGNDCCIAECELIRADFLAIAAELEGQ